jgi:hypothetical protein
MILKRARWKLCYLWKIQVLNLYYKLKVLQISTILLLIKSAAGGALVNHSL